MGFRCTMPGCKATINGWSGLEELTRLRRHFERKHKIALYTDEAAELRNVMEDGHEPRPDLLRILLARALPGVNR